ncbi:hypothetical protein HPP92_018125 [Vanilla planifolia]|uniref:Uncharacterized protein n=1 Tax=Vanilla planifolia TaxID=51239 RepID=A0A835QGV0_VANPL|nr:hypothetical protein HPP92_018125 [Vanilla planifolia]
MEVKNLLTINPADEVFARVEEDAPLYDILNEFQKGYSHMAVVVRRSDPAQPPVGNGDAEVRLDVDGEQEGESSEAHVAASEMEELRAPGVLTKGAKGF